MTQTDIKAQPVRLLDVFVLGPLMIYAASKLGRGNEAAAAALGVAGVATMIYNADNYRRIASSTPGTTSRRGIGPISQSVTPPQSLQVGSNPGEYPFGERG